MPEPEPEGAGPTTEVVGRTLEGTCLEGDGGH
jgi:hypothetical protein